MPSEEQKPLFEPPAKSSMEILSELFSSFDAEPPVIVKKEKSEEVLKKHKKSKKKHKHKDRKHKKKSKKRKRSTSDSSTHSAIDLTAVLIKNEPLVADKDLDKDILNETLDTVIKTQVNIDKNSKETETSLLENKSISKNVSNSESSLSKKGKIIIKDLKFSSIFDATILAIKEKEKLKYTEDGEVTQSEFTDDEKSGDEPEKQKLKKEKRKRKHKHSKRIEEKPKKRKHSHRSHSRDYRSRSHSIGRKTDHDRTPEKSHQKKEKESSSKHDYRHKSRDYDKDTRNKKTKEKEYRSKDDYKKDEDENKIRDRSSQKAKDRDEYRNRGKDDYEDRKRKHRDNSYYKSDDYSSDKDEKWFMRDRYRGYTERDRERERRIRENSEENSTHIDKKKLLEIARKNAIQMMKSGSLPGALTLGPQAQEKVIAAIKSGGKTVEELTDFCKTLSKKEELGELSSISEDNVSDSDGEKPFHHPFQIKERPVSITMNIKNSVPLPLKNSQERASELRMQFPVSSGQQHRKSENEWVPVSPKKIEAPSPPAKLAPILQSLPSPPVTTAPLLIESPPPPLLPVVTISAIPVPITVPVQPGPQVFPTSTSCEQNIDIAAIVSQRLSAMRKLQENPNDVQALNVMYKAQKEMNTWAESKQQIGQFTGSTGAQILSQAELSSGYQAWARKDQLQTAAPVSGGMGMHLLQKMGWKPGEGLGKEKTGTLEPLLLEIKLDKKGIVAKEEQKKKQPKLQKPTVKILQGKHPVSLLGEYASKHKLGAPQYDLCFECGPDHKKNFLFRVILNGAEYKPQIASPNKKEAKANAAMICLQQLGILLP